MAEVRAGSVADLAEGQRILLEIDGREVFVFEREGHYYAFQNVCPHMGGPVGEGILLGKVEAVLGENKELIRERFSTTEIHLVCPWHGYEFDIETGVCAASSRYRIRRFEAIQRGEDVYVVS